MTRSVRKRRAFFALCVCLTLVFGSLGVWQVERLAWKRALIARVESRIHAPATDLPPSADWPGFDAHEAEYRHVRLRGRFIDEGETRIEALTELGAGVWVLTPMRTSDGIVLVNRGFVPADRKESPFRSVPADGAESVVVGLLRPSEPGGRFLRHNDPAADRWYSRDVEAIAAARRLGPVAPFFIDADASPAGDALPRGGLTVVRFRNAHLVYAATWFGLALMCAWGAVMVRRPQFDPNLGL